MRKYFFYTACILLLTSCRKVVEKPVWTNEQSIIYYPAVQLQFKSKTINWSATLLSFIQPIPLSLQYTEGGFTVYAEKKNGLIEGPAQICLSSGNEHFYYAVNLLNKDGGIVTHKDYRSPKTVNPDSSLHQQRIVHDINQYQNLVTTQRKWQYFFEEEITLPSIARNYRAIRTEPLSAFYLQAGTCVGVPIKAVYNTQLKTYKITAGPLKDEYENVVADGTSVVFVYTDAVATNRMETALLHGYATVFIPAYNQKKFAIQARVNNKISKTLQLMP